MDPMEGKRYESKIIESDVSFLAQTLGCRKSGIKMKTSRKNLKFRPYKITFTIGFLEIFMPVRISSYRPGLYIIHVN